MAEQDEANTGSNAGPGSALRRAREAVNVSVDDVAQTLNLSLRVVNGLETNSYEELPVPAFTRGYIRAYAKLMELDADDLVRQFDEATDGLYVDDVVVSRPTPSISAIPQQHPGRVLGGIVVLIVLGAALILWWIWPEDGFPGFDRTDMAAVEQDSEAPARTSVADEPSMVTTETPQSAARSERDPGEVPVLDSSSSPNDALALPTEALDGLQIAGEESLLAQSGDRLVFGFGEDCWVEVEDRDGATIHADLARGGDSLTLVGDAPFTIILGNAPETTLSFNGDAVALGPHTRNRIANLVLGR